MFIEIVSFNITVAYLWLKTDFIRWYFPFGVVNQYINYKNDMQSNISFPDYLFLKNNNFVTKLLSCDVCLMMWSNIILALLFGFNLFFFKYITSVLIYKILCKL